MNNSRNFRVGFQQFALLPPEGTPVGRASFEWYLGECKRIGAHALSMMPVPKLPPVEYDMGLLDYSDMGQVREMAAMAKEADVDYVIYCTAGFCLAGLEHPVNGAPAMDSVAAHKSVEKCVEIATLFGVNTFGIGYGKLETKFGRYNKSVPYDRVRAFVAANLQELGRMLAGTPIMVAYENHCDFTGKEIAQILEDVNHPNVGAMYDVGNAAVVCCDPMADIEYLAPWAVAAHFKDFKVIDNPVFEHLWQDMPMILKGCCLGEGFLDFDAIMQAICNKAKRQKDMLILAEPAFILPGNRYNSLQEMHEFDRQCSYQFVRFMQNLAAQY